MELDYDIIGIGFGPANIAVAIALEEIDSNYSCLFLEQKNSSFWQEEMLMSDADIQNNPIRDLVTPRNPKSHYTFINYLFEQNRLYEHLNLGLEFPLRVEYAQYISWVASFFNPIVEYNTCVCNIIFDQKHHKYKITTSNGKTYFSRSIILAPGRTPHVPSQFSLNENRIFHLTKYKSSFTKLNNSTDIEKVAVIGGSQSAIEIILDLLNFPNIKEIHNLQRGYGFRLKDTSQFSEHVYFPSFVDYYYSCSKESKQRINQHLRYTNYSAADADVLEKLYITMYQHKITGENKIHIHNFSNTQKVLPTKEKLEITYQDVNVDTIHTLKNIDCIILATGFKDLGSGSSSETHPALLDNLYPYLHKDDSGVLIINRDYSLSKMQDTELGPIYLNGLCESSHGYGDAGSFSLLALRSKEIISSLKVKLSES